MMGRDHFKQAMWTPSFVIDNREDNKKELKERNIEKRVTKINNVLLFWKKFKGNK